MKKELVIWLALVLELLVLMAACSGTTPIAETEEPKPAKSVVIEEPTTTGPTAETEEPKLAQSVITEEPTITGPRTGDTAPDFTLPDSNGNMVHLADVLNDKRMVILVFYHAYN